MEHCKAFLCFHFVFFLRAWYLSKERLRSPGMRGLWLQLMGPQVDQIQRTGNACPAMNQRTELLSQACCRSGWALWLCSRPAGRRCSGIWTGVQFPPWPESADQLEARPLLRQHRKAGSTQLTHPFILWTWLGMKNISGPKWCRCKISKSRPDVKKDIKSGKTKEEELCRIF